MQAVMTMPPDTVLNVAPRLCFGMRCDRLVSSITKSLLAEVVVVLTVAEKGEGNLLTSVSEGVYVSKCGASTLSGFLVSEDLLVGIAMMIG